MQSTPNKTSKIPRPGAMSPRVSQGSKSPPVSGSFQENKSPQAPVEALTSTPINDEISLVSRLTQGLEDCNWEQLQGKYADAMEEHGRVEENLRVETAKLLEVSFRTTSYLQFHVWATGRFSWHGRKLPSRKMRTGLWKGSINPALV